MRPRVGVAILVALGSATMLSGCAIADNRCAKAYEAAALAVDGVATASFSCSSGFEHGSQGGSVTVSVESEDEALPVIDEVYRAFASSSELEDAWDGSPSFFLEGAEKTDPENLLDDSQLGIGDDPLIFTLREHYDIHPPGTD